MERVFMTFSEYDSLFEKASQAELVKTQKYFPSRSEILAHEPNGNNKIESKKFIIFLSWLLEINPPPETIEELDSKEHIEQYLRAHLILADTDKELYEIKNSLSE